MAINLSGFLGGLGEGFGAYQKEQRTEDALKFERASEIERQRLARLQDKRAQDAIDRQAKAEERLTQREEYNQGLGIFNQIQEIARADADDDITTARFLRTPGLDEASRQQEVAARLQRYNQRQGLIKQLSGQGKVQATFGDVSALLRPTQFSSPDFKMPKPMIDPVQLRTMTDAEIAKIIKAPAAQKADVAAQARERIGYYADQSYVDANIPEVGKSLGFGVPAKPAKPLESPDTFFQQNPQFTPGVGGERMLPTGVKQVVKYVNGQPVVEYQKERIASYTAPEADQLKTGLLTRQLDFLTRTMDSRVQSEALKAEKLRWGNLLAGKQFEWFDKTAGAKIDKLRQRGSGASDALRRMSIMLAHNDRMAALGQRAKEFELTKTEAWLKTKKEFDDNLTALRNEKTRLEGIAAKSTDLGMGASRSAALSGLKRIDQEIAIMTQQAARLQTGDLGTASQIIGQNFTPAAQLDATQMYADQQAQQQQALLAMQLGLTRPQQAPAPVQMPAQAPIVFSPTISLGGGVAGAPGAAGAGGFYGGGGGVMPGAGGGVMPGAGSGKPGAPASDPLESIKKLLEEANKKKGKGDGKPADADGFLIDKQGKRYRLDQSGRAIYVDAKGKDIGQPLPALPPTPKPSAPTQTTSGIPANYEGWVKDGKPYTGPQYQGYPMTQAQFEAMARSGRPMTNLRLQWHSRQRSNKPVKVKPDYGDTFDLGD